MRAGKKTVVLKLDETSIKFWYQPRQGLGVRAKQRSFASRPPGRQASRGQLRKAVKHVAVICDDAALQAQLPELILLNERTMSAGNLRNWNPIGRMQGRSVERKICIDQLQSLCRHNQSHREGIQGARTRQTGHPANGRSLLPLFWAGAGSSARKTFGHAPFRRP